jgi:hypothetical protein
MCNKRSLTWPSVHCNVSSALQVVATLTRLHQPGTAIIITASESHIRLVTSRHTVSAHSRVSTTATVGGPDSSITKGVSARRQSADHARQRQVVLLMRAAVFERFCQEL